MNHRIHTRSAPLLTFVLAALAVAGCGSSKDDASGATGTPVPVGIRGYAFDPSQMQLKAGHRVTFVVANSDKVEHSLTIDGLKVDKEVSAGKTEKVTATPAAGTYAFHCKYHPQMTGTVTVA